MAAVPVPLQVSLAREVDGDPGPPREVRWINIPIPADQYAELRRIAKSQDRSLSGLVRVLLKRAIAEAEAVR